MNDFQNVVRQTRADFPTFVYAMSKWRGFAPASIHMEMASYLMNADQEGTKNIFAHRNSAKSDVAAYYCLWRWLRVPSTRILILCPNETHQNNLSGQILSMLERCPLVKHLYPDAIVRTTQSFDIKCIKENREKSLKVLTIGSTLTSAHCDLAILDDVETEKEGASELERMRRAEKLDEIDSLLDPAGSYFLNRGLVVPNPELVQVLTIGTYQSEDTLYNSHSLFTAGTRLEIPVYNKEGEVQFKERWSKEAVEAKRARMSKRAWNLHWQLDTTPIGDEFKPVDFSKIIEVPQGTAETRKHKFAFVDPSYLGFDETTWCIIGRETEGDPKDLKHLRISMVYGSHGTSDQWVNDLIDDCVRHKIIRIMVESNGLGGEKAKEIQKQLQERGIYNIGVETHHQQQKKLHRICETLEVAINNEWVRFDRPCLFNGDGSKTELYRQMQSLTYASLPKHDDRIDVVAAAINHFAASLRNPGWKPRFGVVAKIR